MSNVVDSLEKFKKDNKNRVLGRSKLWQYKDIIKDLLENDYPIVLVYEYLRDYHQIKYSKKYIYNFIQRNKDKILNSQTEPVKEEEPKSQSKEPKPEPVKEEEPKSQSKEPKPEPVKEEEIKLKPTAPEPKPQPATPKPKEPEPKQEQKVKTPADRKKEFKRYLGHWDKQPENYLQYIQEKVDEKEFTAVMNRVIEEKLVTSFEDIENFFKEPYKPEYICDYICVCRDKLRNKENFKAFTPAMFQYLMGDNILGKRPPEQL